MVDKAGSEQAPKPVKFLKSGAPVDVGKATQFKPGQSGNPAGMKRGFKHLSTHIQELLNDEEFETMLPDRLNGWTQYKGAPVKAIVKTATIKAVQGDDKAREWLAKYGYGTKVELGGSVDGNLTVQIVKYGDEGNDK